MLMLGSCCMWLPAPRTPPVPHCPCLLFLAAALWCMGCSIVLQSSCTPGGPSVEEPACIFLMAFAKIRSSCSHGEEFLAPRRWGRLPRTSFPTASPPGVQNEKSKCRGCVFGRAVVGLLVEALRMWAWDMDPCPCNTCWMVAAVSSQRGGSRIRPLKLCARRSWKNCKNRVLPMFLLLFRKHWFSCLMWIPLRSVFELF